MMEAWSSQETDPKLFAELLGEFMSCFKAADVNNNGVLEMSEFRVWMTTMQGYMRIRFGEEVLDIDDRECE
jgi:hypothetical protein